MQLPVVLARHAMATRFEIVLPTGDPIKLRSAGEEALDEIDRLENTLSLYRPTSEIAHINAQAARRPVRVSPEVFRVLQQAHALHAATQGAFDISIAPLVQCWGFMGGTGHLPSQSSIAQARACVGMGLVKLDAENYTVSFARPGVMLDLGAIGKGYAIERAVAVLRDCGIADALVHGGTSTVFGLGRPAPDQTWRVGLDWPLPGDTPTIPLRDEALSVSAATGKCFRAANKILGHVLDPRTGEPAGKAVLSAVLSHSATESDAFSTALFVAGSEGMSALARAMPNIGMLLVTDQREVVTAGQWPPSL